MGKESKVTEIKRFVTNANILKKHRDLDSCIGTMRQ